MHKHPNADRLQCATIFGSNVIVDMTYYLGQKIIYFPVDGCLGKEYALKNNLVRIKNEDGSYSGGYLDENKLNIRALKLRGERSDGLALPIESLSDFCDITQLKIGDKITVLNGKKICEKYIPRSEKPQNVNGSRKPKKSRLKKIIKTVYPNFVEHADTAQLAYNLKEFKPNDTCYITLKMHGTSQRTSFAVAATTKSKWYNRLFRIKPKTTNNYEMVTGTRRMVLDDFQGGYYGSNEFRKQYHDLFTGKLPKNIEVYYEVVGFTNTGTPIMSPADNSKVNDKDFVKKYGKQTVFSYGCEPSGETLPQSDIYVYRMTMTNEDGFMVEIPWETVKILCDKMGIKHVMELDKFLFTSEEDLMQRVEKWLDIPDPIGKTHVNEGCVIRIDNREQFTAFKHKSFAFKVLEGIVKDTADAPDIEESQEAM